MDVFEQVREMGHERVVFCSNPEVGLQAIIAIHSTVLGPSLGGCRMLPYSSVDEALTDVLRLARGMTYKAAAAGLNLGGGKAVILGDPKKQKSEGLFRAFGGFVDSLGGHYITAEDSGTDTDDMELILAETRWVTGVSSSHGGSGNPAPVTAYGVLQGMKAAARWRWGDPSLAGKAVAIQGLGSVGSHLARYLVNDERAKVFGCDVDREAAERAAAEIGVEVVGSEEIFDAQVDVFAPCALGAVLNDDTIPRLRCAVVAGAANNQLANEAQHGKALDERGILYAPDYVINAGGLINVYNELNENGYNQDRALRQTRGIYRNMMRVFEIAKADGIPSTVAADRVAEERIARLKTIRPRHWSRMFTDRRQR